ncbi:hypothetical protein HK105_205029 [Polyrhizophydium stewartii]|uniref:N-acetyltransferase ESCO acetyl-transferase domain-containing protein n=1 Tax=Polyrhizophydium stewartii TaxID=2732419 RepID=A0ABR4N794_9FUNG
MEFVAGEDEDQRLHRAYHRTFLNGVRWRNVELPQLFMAADRSYIVHVTLLSSPREWTKGFVCLGVNGNVKGCTIAEPISIAYEAVSTTECSDNPSAAICGISRIWVAAADRRKGVATRLLDAVRHRFVLGCELARNALAFSQPTSAGRHLARQYLGERYKVYR